jgi:hypothetical protein
MIAVSFKSQGGNNKYNSSNMKNKKTDPKNVEMTIFFQLENSESRVYCMIDSIYVEEERHTLQGDNFARTACAQNTSKANLRRKKYLELIRGEPRQE